MSDGEPVPEEDGPDLVAARPRPAFAREYPRVAALDQLLAAYLAGDFAQVRERAPKLADSSNDESLRAAALDLRRRIEPHPLAAILWGLGLALLVLLFGYYLTASHHH